MSTTGTGGRGRDVIRRGSTIAATIVGRSVAVQPPGDGRSGVEGRADASHATEAQQRVAPIFSFGRGRRVIAVTEAESVVEMMVDEQDLTTSTPVRKTSNSSRHLSAALYEEEVMLTPVGSRPSLSSLFTPTTDLEEMLKMDDSEKFEMEEVVVEAQEELEDEPGECAAEEEDWGGSSQRELFEEEDDDDDDVQDRDYLPEPGEGSCEEEEPAAARARRHRVRASGKSSSGRGRQDPQPATTTITTHTSNKALATVRQAGAAPASTGRKGAFTSPIWRFYTLATVDDKYAICNMCKAKLSRGADPSKYGTSSLLSHLASKHFAENEEFEWLKEEADAVRQSSTRPAAQPSAAATASRPPVHAAAAAAEVRRKRTASPSATSPADVEACSASQSTRQWPPLLRQQLPVQAKADPTARPCSVSPSRVSSGLCLPLPPGVAQQNVGPKAGFKSGAYFHDK